MDVETLKQTNVLMLILGFDESVRLARQSEERSEKIVLMNTHSVKAPAVIDMTSRHKKLRKHDFRAK